jgi:ribose-phosphate pyrophosphokinase
MIVVGDPQNKGLSDSVARKIGSPIIYPDITVFPDSEQRVRVPEEKIVGEKVYLVKSIEAPVDSSVLQFSFIVDALNRSGADKVIGVVPYIPYMRADHVFRTGEAVPLELVIKMIEDSGLNEIIIVDPHSIKIPEMFKIPVHNLSALGLFATGNITIVSPDMGGIRRLEMLDELFGGGVNQVTINKDRNYETGSITVAEYKGEIRGNCFIVDDIISTGKTIVQAVETLVQNDADQVYVFATHPVFSESANELLAGSKARKIFVTDSIPVPDEKKFDKLEILSLASLIAASIRS